MPTKRSRLVQMQYWIFTFGVAYVGWSFCCAACNATPPADKRSRFILIGDQRRSSEPSSKNNQPVLVLSGAGANPSETPESLSLESGFPPQDPPADKLPGKSSRKAKLEPPTRIAGNRGMELTLELGASTSKEAAKEKQPHAQPSTPKSKSVRSGIREPQAKDGNECPGGSEDDKPLAASLDDIPLTQKEHPYNAPVARSESEESPSPRLTQPNSQLTSQQIIMRRRINDCLSYYMQHPESVVRRSPWAVMHATLPFGAEAELVAGNRKVNAIGWMCYNGICRTQRLFQPTKTGFRTNIGPGVQGHEGQLLAILAQSHISHNYPIRVGDKQYKIADLVRYEMANCREKSELTFRLIGLSYYVHPEQRWRDNEGKGWTLEKMVAEELEQPVVGTACGGTHRLMGFSYSLAQRRRAGLPITGHWERAEVFLEDFVKYAISLQNTDGSFSTEWFERRANEPDMEKKVQTTGHILEWLVFTVPQDQLESQPIERAVNFILEQISDNRNHDWPIGPRGHSLRALALYNQRVFGATPGELKSFLASLRDQTTRR